MKKKNKSEWLIAKSGIHFEWVGGRAGYLWIGTSPNDHVMTVTGRTTIQRIARMLLIRTRKKRKCKAIA